MRILSAPMSRYVSFFQQAKTMTKANGYFHLSPQPMILFLNLKRKLQIFVAQDTLIGSLVGHYYKSILSRNTGGFRHG